MSYLKTTDIVTKLRERTDYSTMLLCHPPRPAPDRLCHDAADEIERLRAANDEAYAERNCLVAYIASLFPSGTKRTTIPGWDEVWNGCVYIDLPTGQASWHYHDREAHLFSHLPAYSGEWDGHSTADKYDRIARAALPKGENDVTEANGRSDRKRSR
jgi:hypothetical protein